MPKYKVVEPDLTDYPAWWVTADSIEEAHSKIRSWAGQATARKNKSTYSTRKSPEQVKAFYGAIAKILAGKFRLVEEIATSQ